MNRIVHRRPATAQSAPAARPALRSARRGMNLLEIVAATIVLGVIASIVIARLASGGATAKKNACYVTKGAIEVQVQLWRRTKGAMPAANLADIGANVAYFPEGLPLCPVDNSSYTIDTSTGRVAGHAH